MYGNNQYMIESLTRQKDKIDDMIRNYQQPQPVNNFINTNQQPNKDFIEWRILNENEEVDNLYVSNNTLFINDELMILKGVDGSLQKWSIKKTYPIDKKDEKINELTLKIEELERRLNNEYTELNEPTNEFKQSNGDDDRVIKSEPKANSKSVSK